jgi:hypothetical protein
MYELNNSYCDTIFVKWRVLIGLEAVSKRDFISYLTYFIHMVNVVDLLKIRIKFCSFNISHDPSLCQDIHWYHGRLLRYIDAYI